MRPVGPRPYPAHVVPHRLSRADARRVAVRAQLLTAERPADLMSMVRGLALLLVDQVRAVAPSPDLVAFCRLGPAHRPQALVAPSTPSS